MYPRRIRATANVKNWDPEMKERVSKKPPKKSKLMFSQTLPPAGVIEWKAKNGRGVATGWRSSSGYDSMTKVVLTDILLNIDLNGVSIFIKCLPIQGECLGQKCDLDFRRCHDYPQENDLSHYKVALTGQPCSHG